MPRFYVIFRPRGGAVAAAQAGMFRPGKSRKNISEKVNIVL